MARTLSICIPTYNRANYLCDTIENILDQVKRLPNDYQNNIELCISDNHSTDNTSKVVERYQKLSTINIIYNVNERNIGPDANFLRAVSLSNAEFVWLLGSDDKIESEGLKFIYEYIKTHSDVDIFVLNANIYKRDCKTILYAENKRRKNQRNTSADVLFFKSPLEASLNIFYDAGLISILCFRKSLWDHVVGHERFIGSLYVHLYKILSMIRDGSRVVRIYDPPIVANRSGNESILVSLTTFKSMSIKLESFYNIPMVVFGKKSREHLELAKKNIRMNFPPLLLGFWAVYLNPYERILLISKFFKYCKSFPFFYWTIPFLLLPIGCCGKFVFIYPADRLAKIFHAF